MLRVFLPVKTKTGSTQFKTVKVFSKPRFNPAFSLHFRLQTLFTSSEFLLTQFQHHAQRRTSCWETLATTERKQGLKGTHGRSLGFYGSVGRSGPLPCWQSGKLRQYRVSKNHVVHFYQGLFVLVRFFFWDSNWSVSISVRVWGFFLHTGRRRFFWIWVQQTCLLVLPTERVRFSSQSQLSGFILSSETRSFS